MATAKSLAEKPPAQLPARVTYIGDKNEGNVEKGTAVRATHIGTPPRTHYEVHTDRGANHLFAAEDLQHAGDDDE